MRFGNVAVAKGSAQAPTPGWHRDAAVGHRLPNGYLTVHPLGQPCQYCATGPVAAAAATARVHGDPPIL